MGNDGGSIAKRRDLAKEKKFKSRLSCSAVQKAKAGLCALSQEPLTRPIVACKLGFLYNKESLLNSFLSDTLPVEFNHIKSSKDIIEANFQQDASGLACPVSGIEYNGVNKFQIMWNCGCVLSEKALKEIPSTTCILCSKPIVLKTKLNQNKEEQEKMKKTLGIKTLKKKTLGEPTKKAKYVDEEEIEKTHKSSMQSEVYQSLFSKEEADETFCCRHLRAGLR